jgi:hypothetical protein
MSNFSRTDLEILAAFDIPTKWLPTKYQNGQSHINAIALLNQHKKAENIAIKKAAKIKAKSDRAVRLNNYTCQVQRGEEIQFDINEMQLYNNQLKFVEGLYRRLS